MFSVTHQLVSLDIDFERRAVKGVTELSVRAKAMESGLQKMRLHCDRPVVRSVSVDGQRCEFERVLAATRQRVLEKTLQLESDKDEGSLVVTLPEGLCVGDSAFKVRIEFYLVGPQTGLVFQRDTGTVYSDSRLWPGVARTWLPCVDTQHDRSTWDLFYTVPANVEISGIKLPVTVVSAGELTSLVAHPRDAARKVFRYVMSTATAACTLGFAAGPFASAAHVSAETLGGVFAFAPRGLQDEARAQCAFLGDALAFHAREVGAYPFRTFKAVFVAGLAEVITCASLVIAGTDVLHARGAAEAAYEARRVLGRAAAAQWFGAFVTAAASEDAWLVAGLAGHVAAAHVRHSLGANEHRLRLQRDMARLCHADVNQRPLSGAEGGGSARGDSARTAFVRLKAGVVLHMLDRRMVKGAPSLGLARVAAKALHAAEAGELLGSGGHAVGTAWFLRACRRVSGVDVQGFADQWIFGSGCPVFHLAHVFNRKKLAVEITVHQESTNARATAPWARAQVFRGPLTARIREADGTPYEHVLDISEPWRRFEVQFNTKYKRIRRSTKRFHQRQLLQDAADPGEDDQPAALLFGAESASAKRAWRAVEWGEADDESLASATFEWIRVDPDLEWACIVHFEQPAFMWAAQLQRDRDVAAQAEAVRALRRLPSAAASTALMRAVMDARVFYRVRVDAALALADLATERLGWIGLHHLIKIYKARYCLPNQAVSDDDEPLDAPRLPRPNSFTAIGEYFVQKAVLAALSNIRDRRGEAPAAARRVLLAALRYNDNSENPHPDAHYLACLARANANAVAASSRFASGAPAAHALAEIDRLRARDLLTPSAQNVVTCACLDAVTRLSLLQQPTQGVLNTALFAAAALNHAAPAVREKALAALLLHWGPLASEGARLAASVAADARSPRVAGTVARNLAQLLMLRAMAYGRQHSSLLLMDAEPGKGAPEHIDSPARLVGGLESLVDALADSPELRTAFASAVHDSALPDEPRRVLAAVHALVYQTVDESLPPPERLPRRRLKIRLMKPRGAEPLSSDSEDMPLALGVEDALPPAAKPQRRKYQRRQPLPATRPSTDAGDDPQTLSALPPIAGTRPPAIIVADASLNSPVYAAAVPPPSAVATTPSSAAAAQTPSIKLKLKLSKTTAPPPTTPTPKPPPPSTPSTPLSPPSPGHVSDTQAVDAATRKALHRVLRKLSRHPNAFPFSRPVDTVLDGCPAYYDVIKSPMDLATIKRKLEARSYSSPGQLEADVRLMLANCFNFNPPETPVYVMGEALQSAFEEEWARSGLADNMPHIARMSTGKRKSLSSSSLATSAMAPALSPPPPPPAPATTASASKRAKKIDQPSDTTEQPKLPPAAATPAADWQSLCARALLRLQAQPSALEFMAPVDPIKQGVPTYFDVIKSPIDLSTIRSKLLARHSYRSADEFRADVELIFANCFLFNTPSTYVHTQGEALKRVFETTWNRLGSVSDIPMDEKAYERARLLLAKLKRDDAAWPFLRPVDPVALGIPTYFDLVKNPMDFSTIQKRLAKKGYSHVAEFVADIQLVIDDCFLFNIPDTPVHDCGKAILALADTLLELDQWNSWLFAEVF
ncbi:hypothetical protein H4R26_001086 [Coemansia thaxteri]|uniref:Transcription initiation factor TFIID subunit 2 n=1 Tax=Coemansia thaxteri TaxID=2663907 RepID=A0A9W8BJ55_9FUNG|nr:hypothetical protein H4R26_001086 [Coemansia thaxteri]